MIIFKKMDENKRLYAKMAVTALLLCFTVGFYSVDICANANSTSPHIYSEGNVWLYDERGEKLFELPKTYYAKVNNIDDNYYYVTYNGVATKAKKNDCNSVGYHLIADGTIKPLTVNQAFSDFTAIEMKAHADVGAESILEIPTKATFNFIGRYPKDGELWYYVCYEDTYGYLRAERTSDPNVTFEPFVPEALPSVETGTAPVENEQGSVLEKITPNELKIIIIVGLAVPAVAIVVLLFRKKN